MSSFDDWIATRPECVQKFAAEFPFGSEFEIDGKRFYLCGYTESDKLIVSRIDPDIDYDRALQNKEYICAAHFREIWE